MRKNMQRIMSIMLILLLLIPSMVMAASNISIDCTQKNNEALISIKGTRNRPVSITIKDDFRYYYIDQGITDDLGKIEVEATLELDKTYDCQVNIDGTTAAKKIIMKKSDAPNPGPDPSEDEMVDLYIKGYKGVILNESDIIINKNESALSLTTRILDDHGIEYENRKGYIASIDNQSEFDKGKDSGWMFSVNGKFPDVGAGSVRLKDGDSIKWLYTQDLGADIGASAFHRDANLDELSKVIDEALKIVNNKNSTEKEIIKALDNMVTSFEDTIADSKSGDIKDILKESKKASKVLLNALEAVKGEELAIKVGNSAISITKALNNLIDDKSNKDLIEELSKIAEENMGIALSSSVKMEDEDDLNKMIDAILELSVKVEDKLSKINENPNRNSGKSIRIKMVDENDDISEIILTKLLLEKTIDKGIDTIKISSEKSSFEIAPDFMSKDVKADIKIKLQKRSNSTWVRFEQEGKELNNLINPVKIIMPCDINVNDKDNLTVVLVNEDGTKELIGGVYDAQTKSMRFLTHKLGEFRVEVNNIGFKDLSNHKWAVEAINSMAAKGIIGGRTAEEFAPAANITRAEFSALISRMLKYNEDLDTNLPFKDLTADKWYYKSIKAAYRNGLINGKSEVIFDPNGYITREEMSKIIGTILEKNLYKGQDKSVLMKFSDVNSIAPWAEEGAKITVYNEIIKGSNGKFSPKANATRAETAVMLYRLYDLIMY